MQERREARSHSAVANMIAPLQVTVGTATGKIIFLLVRLGHKQFLVVLLNYLF